MPVTVLIFAKVVRKNAAIVVTYEPFANVFTKIKPR